MLIAVIAYLGGVLTILSPCILPVLPFVFARADQPFLKAGLPLLAGMALTFAAVATLAAVGGGWAVRANELGRDAALVLLAIFGVTLLIPSIADRLTRPIVALGDRLSQSAATEAHAGEKILSSFVLGIATGLLWAPCAGPILGLVLTGAALQGANAKTSLLLLAYAAGAATSLACALLIGGRVFATMKRALGAGEWVRRGLGIAVLAGVAAIALGFDTGFLARLSAAPTNALEQALIEKATPAKPATPVVMSDGAGAMMMSSHHPTAATALPIEGIMPSLAGATQWLNSPPLTAEGLRGKVVLVDFWTYSCINCLRTLPYVRAWAEKYKDKGLVVIGVHAPEFAFEKNIDNVRRAVGELGITYPVAIDNDYAIWQGFNNEFWPAHYFIDAQGRIRHHHFGEGDYAGSEKIIQQLLAEAGRNTDAANIDAGNIVKVSAGGAEAAPDMADVQSPETYIGYDRAQNFASTENAARNMPHVYALAPKLALNQWGLTGDWTVGGEHAALNARDGWITYRFHARDLHLVLGPGEAGKPVRFHILIDGHTPGADHGADVDATGNGTVTEQRLYQLVRQKGSVTDRTFEIQFLDPGVEAFAFTFG
ncbi:cytochrome C biogenesis protein [Methylovirgula ligni]|uniref:Cytochrome c biogenesis protein CcdA n=1 Tax=Methylovirgula ligni TaxID=569860 RepID=A0A3D9YSY2_9HYPH|nr:cytochrome c biogenesis protein DipZ [Methylovirgula ligni]QAY94946.1 cytochrome C biogenesis protein [Methylovirgula ligni]REF84603.1 cytochrome c biogenesis protein CcdA [Methylovirgula ligni]